MNKPRFVIYKDVAGYYRWYLQAKNGEKVAYGEAYVTKQSAFNSIHLVATIAYGADIIDTTA